MTNIVKNNSNGYGYSYASLGDIVAQGYTLPKMKTDLVFHGEQPIEYIYYYDSDIKEWIRGARVVLPEGKGMNKAQLYGAALTYARRYTALMALQLACSDDEVIEDIDESGEKKTPRKASDKQIEYLKKLYNAEEQARIIQHYKVEKFEDLDAGIVSQYIASAQQRNKEYEKHNNKQ